MNAGPSGFAHAPVTKGLVLASIGSTVIQSAARSSHRRLPQPLVTSSKVLAFKSPGELLFGCLLLYYFRVLERQMGSVKFGSYATVVTGISYALQLALGSLLKLAGPWSAGPLPLVFASFIPFLLDIPATTDFTVLGYNLTDKVVVYFAGLELLLTSGRKSIIVMAASAVAGILYRHNVFGLRHFRIPRPVVSAISKVLGPLLCDSHGPSIVLASGAPLTGAAAGLMPGAFRPAHSTRQQRGGPDAAAVAAGQVRPGAAEPSVEAVHTLTAMGFSQEQAMGALRQSGNDVQAAIGLLVGGP